MGLPFRDPTAVAGTAVEAGVAAGTVAEVGVAAGTAAEVGAAAGMAVAGSGSSGRVLALFRPMIIELHQLLNTLQPCHMLPIPDTIEG